MTNVQINQNEGEWHIRGQFDLSAGAAVSGSIRGTNMSVSKTATGTYTVTILPTANLKLVELLRAVSYFSGTVPATALGTRVSSVTQAADDTITIVVKTMALPTSGADTDTTAATTINFEVIVRTCKMGNPL